MPEIITHYTQDERIGESVAQAMDQDIVSPSVRRALHLVNYGALLPALLQALDGEQLRELEQMIKARPNYKRRSDRL